MDKKNQFLKYSVFSKKVEILNLLLPVLFIILIFLIPEPKNNLSATFNFSLFFVSEFIFLNTLHVFFTITLLFFVPEFKNYMHDKSQVVGRPILKTWLGFYFFAVIFFSLQRYVNFTQTNNSAIMQISALVSIAINLYIVHHGLSQSVGLSLTHYSSFVKIPESGKIVLTKIMAAERRLVPLVMLLTVIVFMALKLENKILTTTIFSISCLILFIYLGQILFKIYKFDIELFKLKLLFHSRFFLFLLFFYNSLAVALRAAVHGVEYFMVTKTIFSKSKLTCTKRNFFIYLILAVLFSVVTVNSLAQNVNQYFYNKPFEGSFFDHFCYVFSMSLSVVHFFIDSFIYKMSDPAVKSNQGRLLVESGSA